MHARLCSLTVRMLRAGQIIVGAVHVVVDVIVVVVEVVVVVVVYFIDRN